MVDGISYKRHRFPPDVIRYASWLYLRFTLSLRNVEEMLADCGIDVSRETVRYRVIKFGPRIASNLRRRRVPPTGRWHLDEMIVKIGGRRMWLWRQWTTRARSSTCWSKRDEPRRRRASCCVGS